MSKHVLKMEIKKAKNIYGRKNYYGKLEMNYTNTEKFKM